MSNYPPQKTYSQPLPKTALSERKLALYAPIPDSKKKSSLQVEVIANNVHISVYTNIEGDQNKGQIRARLDTKTCYAFLVALAEIVESQKDETGKYPAYRIPAKRAKENGSIEDLTVESWIHVAREDDGRVYIAVTDGKATSIKFHFGPSEFHDEWFYNGKPIDAGKLSTIYANGWGKIMNKLIAVVLAKHYKEPEPRNPQQSKGYNNNNKSYNQPKPQSNPTTSSYSTSDWGGDGNDDIPI